MTPAEEWQQEVREAAARALTVEQLIDLLSEVDDKRMPVQVEGCDCSGWASGISVTPEYQSPPSTGTYPAYVEITRGDAA